MIAPPPSVVIILLPLKLNTPNLINVPKCFFKKLPKASDASSIKINGFYITSLHDLSYKDVQKRVLLLNFLSVFCS